MEGLQPYPEYKDSGVPWLGEIPSHWEILRSGLLFREVVDTGHQDLELLSIDRFKGIIKQHETGRKERASEDRSIYKRIKKGELGYNLMNAFMGSVGISPHDGILSPAYAVGRPQKPMNPLFYHYLYRTPIYTGEFDCCSYGIMYERNRLYYERFKPIPAPYPSLIEQDEIVRTIQYFELLIKDYITKKRKTIDLLNEQKQAIIHQAVTRGLDPSVPMKPSGIEWLGEIPEHWEIKKIKDISNILRGRFSHRPRNDPSLYDGQYPFIQTGDVSSAEKRITKYSQTLNEKGLSVSKLFQPGTLVMTIAANIGDLAILDFEACFPDSIVGLFPKAKNELEFLYYSLKSRKSDFLAIAPVNTQANLNVNRIGNVITFIPPIAEQTKIIKFLDKKMDEISSLMYSIQEEIEFIREYRTRLITDVVTGKLDIRSIAATLPDVEDISFDVPTNEDPEEEYIDEEE